MPYAYTRKCLLCAEIVLGQLCSIGASSTVSAGLCQQDSSVPGVEPPRAVNHNSVSRQATVAKGAAPVAQDLTSHPGLGYGCQLEWRRVLPARHAAGSAVFLWEALVVPGSVLRPAARSCEESGRAGNPRHGELGRRPHAGRIRGSPCGVVPGSGTGSETRRPV